MRSAWSWLVGAHRGVEGTPWGAVVLGNVWPAYVFALALGARCVGFVQTLPDAETATVSDLAQALQEMVTLAFLALVVVLFAIRHRTIQGRRATLAEGVVALSGTFLLTVVGYLPVPDTTATERLLASSAVVIVGTAFTMWALGTLGRCFGILPEVRGLVRGGPYAWVRHPVYLGEVIAAFGMVLAKPHPLVFLVWAVFAGFQYWRTIFEERALAATFPSEYGAYRARVSRLVPGWR